MELQEEVGPEINEALFAIKREMAQNPGTDSHNSKPQVAEEL